MPLTETPVIEFSGASKAGSCSPLACEGTVTESYTGGAKRGEMVGKKAAEAVRTVHAEVLTRIPVS